MGSATIARVTAMLRMFAKAVPNSRGVLRKKNLAFAQIWARKNQNTSED